MSEFSRTQYNFNNRFILNDVTTNPNRYAILGTKSLTDTLAINTEEVRPEEPGSVDYGTKFGRGEWEIPVMLYASSEANMNQLIQNIKQAFNPDLLEADTTYGDGTVWDGYHPMDWTEDVGGTSRAFRIYVKSLEIPKVSADNFAGLIRDTVLKLKANDPRKYLQTQATLSGAGVANNAGTYPTPVTITITATGASSTSLQITNSTTGKSIYITTALANTDVLVIDTRNHSVKLNGVEKRGMLGNSSIWWNLDPGNNTLAVTNGTNVSVAFAWRSAWPM